MQYICIQISKYGMKFNYSDISETFYKTFQNIVCTPCVKYNNLMLDSTDLVAPQITQGLTNITKLDKSKSVYRLSCMASGDPKPDMIWRKDGMERHRSPMIKTSLMDVYQSTYTISSPIRDEDGGVYTCQAYNIGGESNSSTNVLILGKLFCTLFCRIKLCKICH